MLMNPYRECLHVRIFESLLLLYTNTLVDGDAEVLKLPNC